MHRLLVVLALAATLSLTGVVGLVTGADEQPGPAPQVSTVRAADLTGVGAAGVQSVVTGLQARLERLPEDAVAWAGLGLAYVEQARLTGNPAFYAKAEEATERSLSLAADDNPDGLAARAALKAARHDFAGALDDAEAALRLNDYHQGALVIRVDALTELGRYDEQLVALRRADRRRPGVPVATRYVYAHELRGRLDEAARLLRRTVDVTSRADRPWLLELLADVERRRGRLDAAASAARTALDLDAASVPAQATLARIDVARGRLDEALGRWQDVVRARPLPEYQIELADLLTRLGREDEAAAQYDVAATTASLLAEGGVDTDLEVALLAADHGDPAEALDLARAAFARGRSVHAHDALGWALHRTGDHRAALRHARAATRLGTAEPVIWLHRGLVEHELGLAADSRRHLNRGIDLAAGTALGLVDEARLALSAGASS